MATMKQIEANRRNAQSSTGPATAEGRRSSSKNAWKHGLTAREVTVDAAEAKNFAAFRNDMVANLAPQGAFEEELVEEIVIHSWRLRRVFRLEVNDCDDLNPLSSLAQEEAGRGLLSDFRLSLASLIRYETSIARLRERALHNLERLQARRRGELVHAPIVVDVQHATPLEESQSGNVAPEARANTDPPLRGENEATPERSPSAPIKRVRLVREG
jgi:hypothetical protein